MLIFTDGFDSYGSSGTLFDTYPKKWGAGHISSSCTHLPTGGRFGGGGFHFPNVNCWAIGTIGPQGSAVSSDELFWGGSFKTSALPGALTPVLAFYNLSEPPDGTWGSGGGVNLNVRITTAGLLAVYNNTTLLATGTTVVTAGSWHRLEVRAVANDTGVFDLHLDGVSEVTFSGDTYISGEALIRSFQLFGSSTFSITWDDVNVWNSVVRDSEPTTWMGDLRIDTIRPTANGDTVDSTPLSGAAYTMVDDPVMDDDTTYTQSATAGMKDLYVTGDLGDTPTSIIAVVLNTQLKSTGTTNRVSKAKVKNTNEADGDNFTVPLGTYVNRQDAFSEDPATNAPWNAAGVNAMQIGWEVVL